MEKAQLELEILPQPDMTTCGPTSLHAVYRYYGDSIPLHQVIAEIPQLEEGGTLAVVLGCHALRRGYSALIYTFNLQVFDPTWFDGRPVDLAERLRAQLAAKSSPKLAIATHSYLEFIERGGTVRMHDLTSELIRRYLRRGVPILTGLSATYLYQEAREIGSNCQPDDIRGVPTGHFVVLCGYDQPQREVLLADPLQPNPIAPAQVYHVGMDRLRCAILLGIMTFDANLLIVTSGSQENKGRGGVYPDRRG